MAAERRRGLLVDYGGVLTTSVFEAFDAFCAVEGLPPGSVRDAFRDDPRARQLLFDLELGTLDEATFGERLAPIIGVERSDGLAARLFASLRQDEEMLRAVESFRARGVRTGLISNSWGTALYDGAPLRGLFDAMVISGEEGIRKPDPAIYLLGAERLGLPPSECVFVDDLGGNLKPARELGMATILHRSAAETIAELEKVLR